MSKLYDKLKPATKKRGIGKIAPCPKCGRDAEHYSANYIACERCDDKPVKAENPYAGAFYRLKRAFQGVSLTPARWYKCTSCGALVAADPNSVAAGQVCSVCSHGLVVF